MNKLLYNITSYLEFLKNECSLSVSVHFDKANLQALPHSAWVKLLPYNSHENPYCMAVKKCNHEKCMQSQKDVRKICKSGEGFCRTCHAGVYEYIYPICKNTDVIGFIAVSGYRQPKTPAQCIDKNLPSEFLSDADIPVTLCESVIPPLGIIIGLLFTNYANKAKDEYNLILQFLNEYHSSITVSDLCKYFGRSKSHISHMFKSRSGMSISEYCNNLKLQDAKKLLLSTDFSVTQIAFDVGFNDVSYFIHLFKKKFGISPLKYRKMSDSE